MADGRELRLKGCLKVAVSKPCSVRAAQILMAFGRLQRCGWTALWCSAEMGSASRPREPWNTLPRLTALNIPGDRLEEGLFSCLRLLCKIQGIKRGNMWVMLYHKAVTVKASGAINHAVQWLWLLALFSGGLRSILPMWECDLWVHLVTCSLMEGFRTA